MVLAVLGLNKIIIIQLFKMLSQLSRNRFIFLAVLSIQVILNDNSNVYYVLFPTLATKSP